MLDTAPLLNVQSVRTRSAALNIRGKAMANWYCDSKFCNWSGETNEGGFLCPSCKVSKISPVVIRCPIEGTKLHPKAVGLNSRQESVSKGENVSPTIPCPRLSHKSAGPHTTSSQRFLSRFSAGDSLNAATTFPRAMKNRFSKGSGQ